MTSLIMPILFLNKHSEDISHQITSITSIHSHIYTGSQSGDICIWKYENEQYIPDILMNIGYESCCKALTYVAAPYPEVISCNHLVVSLHGDNRVRTWDSEDGRCIASSRKDCLPDVGIMQKIENVQMRAVAVGGRNKKVFLIDVWSMELLYELRTDEDVVSLLYLDNFGSHLASLSSQGQISFWPIPRLSGHIVESDYFLPEIHRPSLTLIMQSEEKPSILSSTPDCTLLAIAYKTIISFIHNTWYEQTSRKEAYIYLKKDISHIHFTDKYFYILTTKSKLLRYSITDLLIDIQPRKNWDKLIAYRNSAQNQMLNNTMKTFIIKRKPDCIELDVFISRVLFTRDKLIISDENRLHVYDCNMLYKNKEYDGCKSTFSMSACDSELFADYRVSNLLEMNENISTSIFVTTQCAVFYILGSTAGRIFVCPMSNSHDVKMLCYHKDEVTCLYYTSDKVISCSADHVMCVWSLAVEDIDSEAPVMLSGTGAKKRSLSATLHDISLNSAEFKYEPLQVINLYGSSGKLITRVDHIIEQYISPEAKRNLTNMILVQGEDGSLLLVSLNTNTAICKFQAVSSKIIHAAIHVEQDYLFVLCEDKCIYIFNMIIQALERIIPSSNSELLFRKNIIEVNTQRESVEVFEYNIIEFNRRCLAVDKVKHPSVMKEHSFGGVEFTVLYTNFEEIRKHIKTDREVRMLAEYLLWEMYSWSDIMQFRELFREDILQIGKNTVKCCIGMFGVDQCISVMLPRKRRNWEVSRCFYSMISIAFLSLVDSLSLLNSKFNKMKEIFELITSSKLHKIGTYKFPDPVLFFHYCISNIPISLQAIRPIFKSHTQKEKTRLLKSLISIYNPSCILSGSSIGITDSILTCIIGYIGSDIGGINDKVSNKLINCIEKMICSKKVGMSLAGCEILSKGWDVWELEMTQEKVREMMMNVLKLVAQEENEYKDEYVRCLRNIAAIDLDRFIEFVSIDIMREDRAYLYASGMLEVIACLVPYVPSKIISNIKPITEIIIHSLNPSYRKIRERNILQATEAIKQLVTYLPMVCFIEKSQKLGIGTPDGEILIYDLDHGSHIFQIHGHHSSISALEFSHSGNHFASYSIEDLHLIMWKEDTSILFNLFSKAYKESSSIKLHSVDSPNLHSSSLLKTPNIAWSSNDLMVQLTREDGKKYIFQRVD